MMYLSDTFWNESLKLQSGIGEVVQQYITNFMLSNTPIIWETVQQYITDLMLSYIMYDYTERWGGMAM